VQKARFAGISVPQAEHWRVKGWDWTVATAGALWVDSEEPQFMQNAAPGLLTLLQRGQIGSAAIFVDGGGLVGWTGVPHSGQNFFPVTSVPQDVHVAIEYAPSFIELFGR
jgi:hypothetical protein